MISEERRIHSKQDLKTWLADELPRYGSGGIRAWIFGYENRILRKHQILLRKTEYYTNTHRKVMQIVMLHRLNKIRNRYGLHVAANTCERGLRIMHLGSVLVNQNASVGKNCVLHINTALVAGGINGEAPSLEDGVVMGVGAVAVGNVHIARNVAVGANAVVTRDIEEEDIAVAGAPAKKVSDNGRTKWNKKNTV